MCPFFQSSWGEAQTLPRSFPPQKPQSRDLNSKHDFAGWAAKGGGEAATRSRGRGARAAALDMERDIIRLKKCLPTQTKGEAGWERRDCPTRAPEALLGQQLGRQGQGPVPAVPGAWTRTECPTRALGSASPSALRINYSSKMTATVR